MTDQIVEGDLLPAYTAYLFDDRLPYDPTTADSVTVKIWRDDVLVVSRPATTVAADGTVTMDWQAGDTDEPGPMLSRVVIVKAGFRPATFPPYGFMRTIVSPAAP